jgi:hypothetical protein
MKSDEKDLILRSLMTIPGVGRSIATDLWHIGIRSIADLKNRDAEELYDLSNRYAGVVQDRCLLYTFRCAVYYASTPKGKQKAEKLKWWNWKDNKSKTSRQPRSAS